MLVNAKGKVQAEILDETGAVLGKSAVFCGDSTKAKLHFADQTIKTLNGKVFRIRFTVDGALYAFGFADENGDFGGAHGAGIVK